MNVLITGAAGFIGFHLSLHLKKQNHFVLGLDNFNSYYDQNLKINREKILNEQGILVLHEDIRNTSYLKNLIKENKITHVLHLAAQAGVRHSFSHPEDYVSSNLEGFVSVLEACKNFKVKLVFASSSSVYGLNEKIPFSVDDRTDCPANLYGATKKANELMAFSYHNIYGIPMVALRYFTVYGPWGRPDMAYYNFTKNILEKKPLNIFNHGDMRRDFTYIDDIVNGTTQALKLTTSFEIFNLGNNTPVKILDLVSILEEKLQKKAILNFLPMQQGEVVETFADISKSSLLLNYHPKISIEKGLEEFLNWYKNYHKI
jgi:UDP-glucuronate 4-epimerase